MQSQMNTLPLSTTTDRSTPMPGPPIRPLPESDEPTTSLYRLPQTKHDFVPAALQNLALIDRLLFAHFGQGPITDLPHAAIHHAFEAQVATNPHAVAAEHQGAAITYGELNRQADHLAAILANHGVSVGDNVALFLRRSIPMLVGIVATLKIGAAYVPQDAHVAPAHQMEHILGATAANVILTTSNLRERVPVPTGHICIAIDDVMQQLAADDSAWVTPFRPQRMVTGQDHCFILFTSGTTGNPNGVQVTHANVCNILLTEPGNLGIAPGMKVGQILSISFDMAAWEILGTLAHGATLIIRGKDFMETVRQVDVLISTPSILSSFDVAQCRNVKVVAVAGEPCPQPLAEKWASFCTFYNSCGPTETTIVNTMHRYVPGSERLTIGKPTPNNTVYVLDEELQPCAIGEVGEMWAGGACVTAGYLHNKTLTNERYAPDPFLGDGSMMFRTRDLGRWTPNGELEHFGRTDDQVKIRGFRVELDSVSAVLESVESCRRAVTLKLDDRHLVGFVAPLTVDRTAAQQAVAAALPYYCTPKFILALETLPMTSRGKIDKNALLQMAREHDAQCYGEPGNRARERASVIPSDGATDRAATTANRHPM